MLQRIAIAIILFSPIVVCFGQSQDLSADGCLRLPPKYGPETRARSHVTWMKDAYGEAKAVRSPVKEMRVAKLEYAGRTALSEFLQEQIADSLRQRGYNDDKEGLNDLRWRILDAWQQQGYFEAKVNLSDAQVLDESPGTRTVAITATIQAGKQYQLDEIRFAELASGAATTSAAVVTQEAAFSAAELRALFLIQQGDIFDTHKIQKGLEELRRAYAARGFTNVAVVPRTQPDKTTDRVQVTLEIDEGKQFRFGHIKLLGLDPRIARPLLESSGLVSGNIFDPTRLDAFYRTIPAALPEGLAVEDYVERRIDEEKSTVDLILRAPCPAP